MIIIIMFEVCFFIETAWGLGKDGMDISACMRVIRKGKPMLHGLYTNPLRMPTNLFRKQLRFILLNLVPLRPIRNDYEINYDTRN